MSVNLDNQRNIGVLAALILGTLGVLFAGFTWLQAQGTTLIEDIAYALLVLVIALYLYDRLLVM